MIGSFFTFLRLIGEVCFELIFPKFCVGCGKLDTFLCQRCFAEIDFYTLPLSLPNQDSTDQIAVMGRYQGVIKKLVTELKYAGIKEIGLVIGELLADAVIIPPVEIITAVPLYPDKLRQRGFNQTEIIGQRLSKLLHLPYQPLLIKTKSTTPQASLTDRHQRLHNLHNCFALNPEYSNQLPASVLLIDDVITTGATLCSCAEVLKQAGIPHVYALTAAHGS